MPSRGAELRTRRVDDPRGGGSLDLAFEVDSDETHTRLTVARPNGEIEERRGHGIELPFVDGSFARVACRHGLQLLPDRRGALREVRRVLALGAEIEVAVRSSIDRNPPFAELADSLERSAGARRAAAVRWLFCMPEPDDLWGVLADAGFDEIRIDVARTTYRCRSLAEVLSRSGLDPRIVPEIDPKIVPETGLPITTETIIGHARRA